MEMSSHQEGQAAIERFNGQELQGCALTVNEAKPQEPRAGSGRSFGSGGGGRQRRWERGRAEPEACRRRM
jgi:hypothetical protein